MTNTAQDLRSALEQIEKMMAVCVRPRDGDWKFDYERRPLNLDDGYRESYLEQIIGWEVQPGGGAELSEALNLLTSRDMLDRIHAVLAAPATDEPVAKVMLSLVQARTIVDAIVEHCRGADFSCDMKAATKEVMRLANVDMRLCRHQAIAGLSRPQRPDLQAWQDAQSEYFDDTIIGIVTEYAEWRDAHTPAAEPVGLREAEDVGLRIADRIRQELTSGRQWSLGSMDKAQREEFEAEIRSTCVAVCEQEFATPSRADDAAQAGGDVAGLEDLLERLRGVHRRNPDEYAELCSIIDAVRAIPSQEVEPAAEGDVMAMARDAAARYFENDPLDKARKAIAASIRQGGTMDYQDATQIALYAICAERRAVAGDAGAALVEAIIAAIKTDDAKHLTEADYMLDANECIDVIRTVATQAAYPTGAGQ